METNVFRPSLSISTVHSFHLLFKPSHVSLTKISRHRRFTIKSSHKPSNSLPFHLTPVPSISLGFSLTSISKPLEPPRFSAILPTVRKSLALALFCVAIGFFPMHALPMRAAAAAALRVPFILPTDDVGRKKASNSKDHEFSGYTQRLLAAVSVLLQRIEEVKSSKGDMNGVREALKAVVARRGELQEEMLSVLNAELRELRRERAELMKRSGQVIDLVEKLRKERDKLLRSEEDGEGGEEVKEKTEKLEKSMIAAEEEYNGIWEKVGEIEDTILKKETMTYSVGVRELSFIQRESELLVERFSRRWRQQSVGR